MKVKFKKLHEKAVIPTYAKEGDAGLDLTCVSYTDTPDFREYKFGIAIEIPKGYVGLMFPRSSITKKDLIMKNSVGIIDSGYRGELVFRALKFELIGKRDNYFQIGERVAQLIIMPFPTIEMEEVEELSASERGTKGFGSSGK
jgi:dUTP pyrophosphatase